MYFHSHLPIFQNDFYTNLEQTAKTVARVVVKNIPAAYELLTDKGGVFCNKLAEEIHKILGKRKNTCNQHGRPHKWCFEATTPYN